MHRAKEAFCSAPPGSSLPPCSCDWLPWAPNASRCACAKELGGVATCFNRAFCESRAPSLCKSAKWCHHRAMRLVAPQAFAPGAFGCCNKVSMGDVYWRREQWAKEPLAERPPGMLIHRVQE